MERRRDVGRDVELPEVVVAGQVAIRAVDEAGLFVFAELDARQLQGVVDHRERDFLGAGVLHARPQHAGHQRRAEAGAGKGGHEAAAGLIDILHAGKYRIKSNLFAQSNQ